MNPQDYIPFVRFRLPDGTSVVVPSGGLIGRASTADLCIRRPEISEAHAFVSLRGRELHLLSLRRWIVFGGERRASLVLRPGQRLFLSESYVLEVESVVLPAHCLYLVCNDEEVCALCDSVYSFVTRQTGDTWTIHVFPQFVAQAPAYLWSDASRMVLQVENGVARSVVEGSEWTIAGQRFRVVARPSEDGASSTGPGGQNDSPLTIRCDHDNVRIDAPGRPTVVLMGVLAQIISELAAVQRMVAWEAVAREVWGDMPEREALRKNWDRCMSRLRIRLRDSGIRQDLIQPDYKGNVQLFLLPQDRLLVDGA